jgi:hypothetical protein
MIKPWISILLIALQWNWSLGQTDLICNPPNLQYNFQKAINDCPGKKSSAEKLRCLKDNLVERYNLLAQCNDQAYVSPWFSLCGPKIDLILFFQR